MLIFGGWGGGGMGVGWGISPNENELQDVVSGRAAITCPTGISGEALL